MMAHLPDGAGRRGNLRPKISSLLRHRSSDTRSLHLSLGIYDHTSVIYKELTQSKLYPRSTGTFRSFFSRPFAVSQQQQAWLNAWDAKKQPLPFLRSSGFPFLTEAMNISPAAILYSKSFISTSSRKSVETSTSTSNRDNVQVLCSSVIGTVHNSSSRKSETHLELVSSSTTTSYKITTLSTQ